MRKGIAVYRLNKVQGEDGIITTNHAANNRFLAVIDNEVWNISGNGHRQLTGLQSEIGPFSVAGTPVLSLANLPEPVQAVIAERFEALDK